MAKRDAYNRSFPIRIAYKDKELASRDKIQSFEKMTESAFQQIERAIGDIYNTENATNSSLANNQLFINSLGRSIGSMADIVPPLSGVEEFAPVLANRLSDATYNVIPHPNQTVKMEVGCKWDMTASPTATARTCVKNQLAFYRQTQGPQTGVCQSQNCPLWSARDNQRVNSTICQTDPASQTFREYKLVAPPELRETIIPKVRFYVNAGQDFDKYRIDGGTVAFGDDRTDPSQSWALATNDSFAVSGVSETIIYEFLGLNPDSQWNAVLEIPQISTSQKIKVNNIPLATLRGSTVEPTRFFFQLDGFDNIESLRIEVTPTDTSVGTRAAVSQIWVIENESKQHRNYDIPLLLPAVLQDLSTGTEIPPNFLQIFDTDPNVNQMVDNTRVFKTRFNPVGALNINTNREAFDVKIFGDQKLGVGNDRYLAVTVGTAIAPALGALMEAFVEHVSNTKIHLSREQVCALMADRSFCCDDRLQVQLSSTTPANRVAASAPATYIINAFVFGGFPPYTVTVDWGDGVSDATATPVIVSGIQAFTLTTDVRAGGEPQSFTHVYDTAGTFAVTFDVADDPDVFGCIANITSQVSPFNVGNPPVIDAEVRLDFATDYPSFVYQDITAGYNFGLTTADNYDSNPTYHVITQVHNTDLEDGKPREFAWAFNNPGGLTFDFWYENVSGVTETFSFTNGSGTLANDLIQQDSLVLTKGSRVFEQTTDYTVDWSTGVVTTASSGSIGLNEASVSAFYFHYQDAASVAAVNTGEWVKLGTSQTAQTIQLSTLTSRTDLNTVRFKVKE